MILTVKNKTDGRLAIEALGQSLDAGEEKSIDIPRRKVANFYAGSGDDELGQLITDGDIELISMDTLSAAALNPFLALV